MTGKIEVATTQFPSTGEGLIYIVSKETFAKDENLKLLDKKTGEKLKEKFKLHHFSGKEGEVVSLEVNDFYKEIIVVGSERQWRKALAEGFRLAQSKKLNSVTLFYQSLFGEDLFEVGKQVALAFYLTNYYFDTYKSEEERRKTHKISNFQFLISKQTSNFKLQTSNLKKGIEYGRLISEGVYLSRDLVNQPASHLHPETLVEEVFKIEKEARGEITVEVLDEDECRRLGMGAFLGVAQGSERKPKFIVLRYDGNGNEARMEERLRQTSPKNETGLVSEKRIPNRTKICLIGKSITFDSGGLSLKPSEGMETMKMDMAGGATVLGIFKILAHLGKQGIKINSQIYGILPACENMPSGKALKPGDIVTALNGKTIEVLNTDAEGRLTLADALSYAEKYLKPEIIIDLATLTGACMVALGKEIAGMFGNDDDLLKFFAKIAKEEGEELWWMPLFKPYGKKLKSEVADIKNISGDRWGGAIIGALFLSEFVKSSKWIHLDIAGPAFSDQVKGIIPKGGTGWGVLTVVQFIKNYVN